VYPVVTVYTQLPPKKPEQRLIILGFVVVSALVGVSFFSSILKNYKKKESISFFIEICLVRHGLELEQKLVATRFLPDVDDRIRPFMVGKIVGFLNDAQHLLVVEMFLNEFFEYDSQFNFMASFVCLNDFKNQRNSTRFEKVKNTFSNKKLQKVLIKGRYFIWWVVKPDKTK